MDTILGLPLVLLGVSGFLQPFGILPALLIGIFYTLGWPPHFLV